MNQNAPCYGQRTGHNFPYTGADCTECGVNQNILSGKVTAPLKNSIHLAPKKPPRGIHSELHWLVDELRKDFRETAKKGKGSFGFYLGYLKRIGFQEAYRLWREVKDAKCDNPGKLFWWKYKQLIESRKVGSSQQKCNDNV